MRRVDLNQFKRPGIYQLVVDPLTQIEKLIIIIITITIIIIIIIYQQPTQFTAGHRPLQFLTISLDPRLLASSSCQPSCAYRHFTWPADVLHYVYRDADSTLELEATYTSFCDGAISIVGRITTNYINIRLLRSPLLLGHRPFLWITH
jgi:hypothetical protein